MADTVSVIIPAYNAAGHIRRSIDSALNQTHSPVEVIVVDDGSKDYTTEIALTYGAPVRLIRKENGGPASARNLGASQAVGNWLALLDADDWWFPGKLAAELACDTDAEIGLIHCLPDHRNDIVPARLSFQDMWANNWIINSSVLIRRVAFVELGGFDEARELISVEDYNLWIRLAASKWKIVTCPQMLVHYTRGIGLSSDTERYLQAQLLNVEHLGRRLQLPEQMVRQKSNSIIFDFGCRALYERKLPFARKLLWRAFMRERSVRTARYLLISAAPAPVLDIRRQVVRSLLWSQPDIDETAASPDTDGSAAPFAIARRTASIVDRQYHTLANVDHLPHPLLITTIDAEEDFDWTRPVSRASTNVTSMRSQHLAHRVFERFGVVPTYMVDYPVATQDAGRAPLRELLQAGRCDIGAQLHPWVTPPFTEAVSLRNSYPGNLPAALEFAKIDALTGALQTAFGVSPRIFRAGRYGVGANTGAILQHFGYQADSSVVPYFSFGDEGGPDFRMLSADPFWIDREQSLLELPLSSALVGGAARLPPQLTAFLFRRMNDRAVLPFALARLGLIERIKVTPEGLAIRDVKRLVRDMVARRQRVFVLTFHSPSLEPGNTPYVRTTDDLQRFLAWLEEFYTFFISEMHGRCATWQEVRASVSPNIAAAPGFDPAGTTWPIQSSGTAG